MAAPSPWTESAYTDQYETLLQCLSSFDIRTRCYAKGLLTDAQAVTLSDIPNCVDHNQKLLTWLEGGDHRTFKIFLDIIRDTGPILTVGSILTRLYPLIGEAYP